MMEISERRTSTLVEALAHSQCQLAPSIGSVTRQAALAPPILKTLVIEDTQKFLKEFDLFKTIGGSTPMSHCVEGLLVHGLLQSFATKRHISQREFLFLPDGEVKAILAYSHRALSLTDFKRRLGMCVMTCENINWSTVAD